MGANVDKARYKRVAVKLSGEALMGEQSFGISPDMIKFVAGEIRSVVELGVQIGIVVGGGQYFPRNCGKFIRDGSNFCRSHGNVGHRHK